MQKAKKRTSKRTIFPLQLFRSSSCLIKFMESFSIISLARFVWRISTSLWLSLSSEFWWIFSGSSTRVAHKWTRTIRKMFEIFHFFCSISSHLAQSKTKITFERGAGVLNWTKYENNSSFFSPYPSSSHPIQIFTFHQTHQLSHLRSTNSLQLTAG